MATQAQITRALALIDTFAANGGSVGWFLKIPRSQMAQSLRERVRDPSLIDTSNVNLCGPATLIFAIARDNPEKYVTFATELYNKGRANLGKLAIAPGVSLRVYSPPLAKVSAADWVVLASIRDSENFIADFSKADTGFGGITLPGALEDWFIAAGYSDVIEECNLWFTKDEAHARRANDLFRKGYKISLFINDQMLYAEKMNEWSSIPTHWIQLTTTIMLTAGSVNFECFTWGDSRRSVPQTGQLTLKGFLNNYYGFVAALP